MNLEDFKDSFEYETKCNQSLNLFFAVSPNSINLIQKGKFQNQITVFFHLNKVCVETKGVQVKQNLNKLGESILLILAFNILSALLIKLLNFKKILDLGMVLKHSPPAEVTQYMSFVVDPSCEQSHLLYSDQVNFDLTHRLIHQTLFSKFLPDYFQNLSQQDFIETRKQSMRDLSNSLRTTCHCLNKISFYEMLAGALILLLILSNLVQKILKSCVSKQNMAFQFYCKCGLYCQKFTSFSLFLIYFENLKFFLTLIMLIKGGSFGILDFCNCFVRSFFVIYPFLKLKEILKDPEIEEEKEKEKVKEKEKENENEKKLNEKDLNNIDTKAVKTDSPAPPEPEPADSPNKPRLIMFPNLYLNYLKNNLLFASVIFSNRSKLMAVTLMFTIQLYYYFYHLSVLNRKNRLIWGFLVQECFFIIYVYFLSDFTHKDSSGISDHFFMMLYSLGNSLSILFMFFNYFEVHLRKFRRYKFFTKLFSAGRLKIANLKNLFLNLQKRSQFIHSKQESSSDRNNSEPGDLFKNLKRNRFSPMSNTKSLFRPRSKSNIPPLKSPRKINLFASLFNNKNKRSSSSEISDRNSQIEDTKPTFVESQILETKSSYETLELDHIPRSPTRDFVPRRPMLTRNVSKVLKLMKNNTFEQNSGVSKFVKNKMAFYEYEHQIYTKTFLKKEMRKRNKRR